jgi:anti-anti-sigma regulatory factor
VVSAQPSISRLFRLTGLDGAIPLARTLEDAAQALAARSLPLP